MIASAIRQQIARLEGEVERADVDQLSDGRIEVLEALLEFHSRRLNEIEREGDTPTGRARDRSVR